MKTTHGSMSVILSLKDNSFYIIFHIIKKKTKLIVQSTHIYAINIHKYTINALIHTCI
jgi:hypothetical protein